MNRKTIGCILSDIDGNFNSIIWREIHRAAQKADCHLLVFEGRALKDPAIDYQHNFIYGLAKKAHVDGYLVNSSQLCRFTGIEQINAFCLPFLERHVPLVSFGLAIEGATNLLVDSQEGLRALIDHLIVHHGYRRLVFIKGPGQNLEANERFAVYCDALAQYGIPFDADMVEPGDFGSNSGYLAYQNLDAKGIQCDVIICANDDIATGAFRYLMEQRNAGRELTTDHITGFDNTLFSLLNQPSITTVAQPFADLAEAAFKCLCKPLEDEQGAKTLRFPTKLVIRSSCGCDNIGKFSITDELLLLTSMSFRVHQSMQTFSLEEFFNEIDRVLEICSIRNCHIVMYPEALIFDSEVEIPKIVCLIYSKQDNQIEHYLVPVEFPSADLIPGDTWKSGGRTTRIFKPLFFRNEQLGYVVFEPLTNNVKSFEAVRGQISNMLKVINLLLRQKEIEGRLAKAVGELQEFNRTLNILSIRDELTGLLNRRGFFNAVQSELEGSGENAQEFLVIFADIDGMKSINDVYGHEEGDAAIRGTAEMLRKVFRTDDVIARMGGDEFIVYARHAAPSFFEKVQERAELVLAEIRAVSPKPYWLSVSLGCACFDPHTPLSLSELLREADKRLYEEKRKKKEEAKATVERG